MLDLGMLQKKELKSARKVPLPPVRRLRVMEKHPVLAGPTTLFAAYEELG